MRSWQLKISPPKGGAFAIRRNWNKSALKRKTPGEFSDAYLAAENFSPTKGSVVSRRNWNRRKIK